MNNNAAGLAVFLKSIFKENLEFVSLEGPVENFRTSVKFSVVKPSPAAFIVRWLAETQAEQKYSNAD